MGVTRESQCSKGSRRGLCEAFSWRAAEPSALRERGEASRGRLEEEVEEAPRRPRDAWLHLDSGLPRGAGLASGSRTPSGSSRRGCGAESARQQGEDVVAAEGTGDRDRLRGRASNPRIFKGGTNTAGAASGGTRARLTQPVRVAGSGQLQASLKVDPHGAPNFTWSFNLSGPLSPLGIGEQMSVTKAAPTRKPPPSQDHRRSVGSRDPLHPLALLPAFLLLNPGGYVNTRPLPLHNSSLISVDGRTPLPGASRPFPGPPKHRTRGREGRLRPGPPIPHRRLRGPREQDGRSPGSQPHPRGGLRQALQRPRDGHLTAEDGPGGRDTAAAVTAEVRTPRFCSKPTSPPPRRIPRLLNPGAGRGAGGRPLPAWPAAPALPALAGSHGPSQVPPATLNGHRPRRLEGWRRGLQTPAAGEPRPTAREAAGFRRPHCSRAAGSPGPAVLGSPEKHELRGSRCESNPGTSKNTATGEPAPKTAGVAECLPDPQPGTEFKTPGERSSNHNDNQSNNKPSPLAAVYLPTSRGSSGGPSVSKPQDSGGQPAPGGCARPSALCSAKASPRSSVRLGFPH
ncbi:WAS/WASL-interacting protein family member 1-like [Perognathus longimembris pacificus]|uniref:WAS/WASL-interacting protein family member 1-like n=1 Tax=Perognathus longimembris pacificus TaxID=214514 RepID=UPI002018F06D|nr:WAS/WASL-interacting protein family member 1-like [Perognathus longimembris pacificus]